MTDLPHTPEERRRASEAMARFALDARRPLDGQGGQRLPAPAPPPARRAGYPVLAYIAALALGLGLIWGPVVAYLKLAPSQYESRWRIILPGDGVRTGLNLDEVGEAKSSAKSPFASRDIDPRATYREIAGSSIVTALAAGNIGTKPGSFERPKIKAVPQTAILAFTIRRGSAAEALDHARAYVAAFDARVTDLREADLAARHRVSVGNIDTLKGRLTDAREAKRALQDTHGLMSLDQFDAVVRSADGLAADLTNERAALGEMVRRFRALSASLRIDPGAAGDALVLKSDRLFQTMAKEYSDTEAELATLSGTFGPNHPTLVATRSRRDELQRGLDDRGRALIGSPPRNLRLLLDLSGSPERAALFGSLMETYAALAGQKERVMRIARAAAEARDKVERLSRVADDLSAAQREQQVAEAVYGTMLADVDLSQMNPFAAYPLYQLLDAPALASKSVGPHSKAALAGGGAATLFLLLAIGAFALRRRFRLRLDREAAR